MDEIAPREALQLYERNWRQVDRAALSERETALIDARIELKAPARIDGRHQD